MAVKFGLSQIKNPTPSRLGTAVQVINVTASSMIVWVGTTNFITPYWSGVIQSILGLIVLLSSSLKPFFGIETNANNVPMDEVTEMEEPKND
jgi:hypothetical protein